MTYSINILAADNNQSSSSFNIFIGYGYFDYHQINNQLDTYHHIDGIKTLPIIGLDLEYIYSNFMLKNQLSASYYKYRANKSWGKQNLKFWEIQDQIKIGYCTVNNQNNRLFPFTGILLQYLAINTDFNYGVKCINCFFQYNHEYSNFNIGILYGISYELSLPLKNNFLQNINIGLDFAGIIPIQNKKWWFDGKKIENTKYVPKGNFRYFGNLKLIYHF